MAKINIIAVGVEAYKSPLLDDLRGTLNDVARLKEVLVESEETALFGENQWLEIIDPSLEDFRKKINSYIKDVAQPGDILIFYFSGHGTPVGNNDFGFCVTDTEIHNRSNSVLPLSVIKFSDLLTTLSLCSITPVIIIDACFSGIAGQTLLNSYRNLHAEITSQHATNYLLLSSCASWQTSLQAQRTGVFSNYLCSIAEDGLGTIPGKNLTLRDLFPAVREKVLQYTRNEETEMHPMLFLGESLPEIDFVKNVQYHKSAEPHAGYTFGKQFKDLLLGLWNNGVEQEFTLNTIRERFGIGAYANHRKLSYSPWRLIEDNPITKDRKLTDRGRNFIKNNLQIPKKIVPNPNKNDYEPAKGTEWISIKDI